jgi:hypothetical protein
MNKGRFLRGKKWNRVSRGSARELKEPESRMG